jgi:hypothetical protein
MAEILSAERVAVIQQAINKYREGPAQQQRRVWLETDAAVEALAEVLGEIPRLQALHVSLTKDVAAIQQQREKEQAALTEAKAALARFVDSARSEQQKIAASLKAEHDQALKVRTDRLGELDVKIATKARQLAALEDATA